MLLLKKNLIQITILFFIFTFFSSPVVTFSHGTKGHNKTEYTNYEAIKKSIELFDTLLKRKKLMETWELDLSTIKVSRITVGKKEEIVVIITRSKGTPQNL